MAAARLIDRRSRHGLVVHESHPVSLPYPSGTVTLLFTDIEGSTKRWEHLPAAMSTALLTHDLLLRAAIEEHNGVVFKTIGDAFCAAFADPADALAAAVEAQQSLAAERWGEVGPVRVRMALHTGEPEHRDRDYFGPPVNRVARLLSTGYGEQILVSAATASHISTVLPDGLDLLDLGAHRLKDLLQPERIYQVAGLGLTAEFPPIKSLDRQPHNLPAQATPMVGRDAAVAAARALIEQADAHLVTLTGPGGIGKTRLGLQVAAELVDAFPDGAWFVPLASVADPALVVPAIAQPLGVRESGHEPLLQTVIDYLRDKRLLLVLDNVEHVAAAAPDIGKLLAACEHLRVLATSRAALRIYGERELAVPALDVPDPKRLPPLAELAKIESVELFVERAMAVKPGFDLNATNAPAIVGICTRLDGLPLAIELAAARVRILPPDKLLDRLASRLGLLTGGASDRDPRQQTLRGAIAWSHELLPPAERVLFRRLAVFAGGWTFDAAESVCAGDGAGDVLDGLDALAQQSLVRQEERAGEPRFAMLETIREFGLEQLEESGEAETIRRAHADHFLAFAESAEQGLNGAEQAEWLDRLEAEHDNLRAALNWNEQAGNTESGLRLAGALVEFWGMRGHLTEGRSWLEKLIADSDAAPPILRAKVLKGAGGLAGYQGDLLAAMTFHERELVEYRTAGDALGTAQALHNLGAIQADRGDYSRATALLEESLALFRSLGDQSDVGTVLNWLGAVAFLCGAYDRAAALYEQSLAQSRRLGNAQDEALALCNLAEAEQHQGKLSRAMALYHDALELFRRLGDGRGAAFTLLGLGQIALEQHDLPTARAFLVESLSLSQELGDNANLAACLDRLGALEVVRAEYERGVMFHGAAEALRNKTGIAHAETYAAMQERSMAEAYAAIGSDRFKTAQDTGFRSPLGNVIAMAIALPTNPIVGSSSQP